MPDIRGAHGLDPLNSSGTEEKNHEDLDSRASGTKTNGADSSDNEAESSMNESGNEAQQPYHGSSTARREGTKRSAGGDIAPTNRHCRSNSMDSFMGNLPNFGDESPKLPPSPGNRTSLHSHSNSLDGTNSTFSLEFGNGEFTGAELKKIMANEKLAEIAMADPKRAKRILANRQSAARSKERKMRYISELEHKVQTLQIEATTLSTQLTMLQVCVKSYVTWTRMRVSGEGMSLKRDSAGLTSQNSELKFRLQAMEQQAQLRDALNEALTGEVQRLKLVTSEMGSSNSSSCITQQLSMSPQLFNVQHQKPAKLNNMYQLQQQQQQQPQNNSTSTKHETNQ